MRRQLFFSCLLLCALILSGWGGVLAAAVCPHTARAAKSVKMDDDHACCHAQVERTQGAAGEHCSQASHQAGVETDETRVPEPTTGALGASVEICSHCVRHNGLPTEPFKTGDAAQHRSDVQHLAAQTLKPIVPASPRLVSAIAPTQGSPPGPTARKHLLLGVFLI